MELEEAGVNIDAGDVEWGAVEQIEQAQGERRGVCLRLLRV